MYRKTCIVCGKEFDSERRSKITDTDACRQKLHRQGKSIQRWEGEAVDIIEALRAWVDHPIHGEIALNAMKSIFHKAAHLLADAQGMQHVNDNWWLLVGEDRQVSLVDISAQKSENRSHTD